MIASTQAARAVSSGARHAQSRKPESGAPLSRPFEDHADR
jgi:hypothetical protein